MLLCFGGLPHAEDYSDGLYVVCSVMTRACNTEVSQINVSKQNGIRQVSMRDKGEITTNLTTPDSTMQAPELIVNSPKPTCNRADADLAKLQAPSGKLGSRQPPARHCQKTPKLWRLRLMEAPACPSTTDGRLGGGV